MKIYHYRLLMFLLSCLSLSLVGAEQEADTKNDAISERASGSLQEFEEKYRDHLQKQWQQHSLLSSTNRSRECVLQYTMRDENQIVTSVSTFYLLKNYGTRSGDVRVRLHEI